MQTTRSDASTRCRSTRCRSTQCRPSPNLPSSTRTTRTTRTTRRRSRRRRATCRSRRPSCRAGRTGGATRRDREGRRSHRGDVARLRRAVAARRRPLSPTSRLRPARPGGRRLRFPGPSIGRPSRSQAATLRTGPSPDPSGRGAVDPQRARPTVASRIGNDPPRRRDRMVSRPGEANGGEREDVERGRRKPIRSGSGSGRTRLRVAYCPFADSGAAWKVGTTGSRGGSNVGSVGGREAAARNRSMRRCRRPERTGRTGGRKRWLRCTPPNAAAPAGMLVRVQVALAASTAGEAGLSAIGTGTVGL